MKRYDHCLYQYTQLNSTFAYQSIVAAGYDAQYDEYNRLVQFLKYHIWSASSAFVTCPSAMQDGAAAVLKRQLAQPTVDEITRQVFSDAYKRLIARDPSKGWTSGQWMTERKGGSDVSGTETIARYIGATHDMVDSEGLPLGPWEIDGFKWFSSATDCAVAIVLAQTQKGLSCFFAPTKRIGAATQMEELNGIKIQRLKTKIGTKALPTAELELKGMRAYLIGEEGSGIKVISTMLNITRLHTASKFSLSIA